MSNSYNSSTEFMNQWYLQRKLIKDYYRKLEDDGINFYLNKTVEVLHNNEIISFKVDDIYYEEDSLTFYLTNVNIPYWCSVHKIIKIQE